VYGIMRGDVGRGVTSLGDNDRYRASGDNADNSPSPSKQSCTISLASKICRIFAFRTARFAAAISSFTSITVSESDSSFAVSIVDSVSTRFMGFLLLDFLLDFSNLGGNFKSDLLLADTCCNSGVFGALAGDFTSTTTVLGAGSGVFGLGAGSACATAVTDAVLLLVTDGVRAFSAGLVTAFLASMGVVVRDRLGLRVLPAGAGGEGDLIIDDSGRVAVTGDFVTGRAGVGV
jgi:hypothetical protein